MAQQLDAVERLELAPAQLDFVDDELMRLCRAHGITWGDAHHVVAAERLELPLLTADERLVRALASTEIWVESIRSRPQAEPH